MAVHTELTPEKFKKRMEQAEEMSCIWEKNNEIAQAYLKGCISTAMALAGGAAPSPTTNE